MTRFLAAALAALTLVPAATAADPAAPPSNLPALTAPASNLPAAPKGKASCGCPLAECTCGPLCQCPVPAAMPAAPEPLYRAYGTGPAMTLSQIRAAYPGCRVVVQGGGIQHPDVLGSTFPAGGGFRSGVPWTPPRWEGPVAGGYVQSGTCANGTCQPAGRR